MTASPVTETERWQPDIQLVPALLSGSRVTMRDLDAPDRCWAVAGLTRAGLTADEMADRLCCSLRLVRTVRADPMTELCLLAQAEADHFSGELRLIRSELSGKRRDLDAAVAENDRLRTQIARMVASAGGTCANGHVLTRYNTYTHRGRAYCRECHRQRQASYRLRRRTAPVKASTS